MNYTDIKNPYDYNIPYFPNLKKNDTRNVFKYERLDEPILYIPYINGIVGNAMEETFHKKCPKSINTFFYPQNAQEFFNKNTEFKKISYPITENNKFGGKLWYNTTYNIPDDKKNSDLLSTPYCKIDPPESYPGYSQKIRKYPKDPECFFKNNQLQSSFHNYTQTEPLRTVHKYISSYDKNIDRVSCGNLPTNHSHKHATAL